MTRFTISLEDDLDESSVQSDEIDAQDDYAYETNVAAMESISNEIQEEISDNARTMDIADGLSSLQAIVARIDEPSETDIALIQTSANMAVAGTDTPAQAILPSMESFKDNKLALEGLGDKIGAALQSAFDSTTTVWNRLASYVAGFVTVLGVLKKKVGLLKQRVGALEAEGMKFGENITIKQNAFFIFDGKCVDTFDKYLDNMESTIKTISQYSNDNVKAVLSTKNNGWKALASVTGTEKYSKEFFKQFKNFEDTFFSNSALHGDGTGGGRNHYKSKPLSGGKSFFAATPTAASFDTTSVNSVKSVLDKYTLGLTSNGTEGIDLSTIVVKQVKLKDLNDLVSTLEHALAILQPYTESDFTSVFRFHSHANRSFSDFLKGGAVGGGIVGTAAGISASAAHLIQGSAAITASVAAHGANATVGAMLAGGAVVGGAIYGAAGAALTGGVYGGRGIIRSVFAAAHLRARVAAATVNGTTPTITYIREFISQGLSVGNKLAGADSWRA